MNKNKKPVVVEEPKVIFDSGAQRSERMDTRYDLIPTLALRRIGRRYQLGTRYGEWNWAKGFPLSDLMNHTIDHLLIFRDRYVALKLEHPELSDAEVCAMLVEERSDDDLAGAAWGIITIMELEERGKLG